MIPTTFTLFYKGRPGRPPRPFFDPDLYGVDIGSEYALIQKKRSTLSANVRERVVARYEKYNNAIELRLK